MKHDPIYNNNTVKQLTKMIFNEYKIGEIQRQQKAIIKSLDYVNDDGEIRNPFSLWNTYNDTNNMEGLESAKQSVLVQIQTEKKRKQ